MKETKELAKKQAQPVEKPQRIRSVVPLVDIYENNDEIIIHAEMPGVAKTDVQVNIDNGTLSISGLRRLDNKGVSTWEEFTDVEFVRKFSVPQAIDTDRVEAALTDGLLQLHLPKSEAAKPKSIEIKAA